MSRHPKRSALSRGLINCLECGRISRLPPETHARLSSSDQCPQPLALTAICPTCGAKLSHRKEKSLTRTWALVLTGIILYIPANLFPIMTVEMLGSTEPETIFSGVTQLFQSGMWAIGLLVFCASITVPLMKLIGLTILLITVHYRRIDNLRDRTRIYRIIEFIGRWSMLDVFLLSILVAVVNLGGVATISPEIGMIFFATVVVITMFAANSFDPRLLWDAAEKRTLTTSS